MKVNESDFEGYIADSAQSLREKIEKYGRRETAENGGEVVRLCFYENEGEKFIWQFLAAAKTAMYLHMEIVKHEQLAELNDSLIEKYQGLVELLETKISDGGTENGDNAFPQ